VALFAIALVLALLAAGCGGSTVYTVAKTRDCLTARGATIGKPTVNGKPDFVGSTATGGAFSAALGDNGVELAFGQTEEDAKQIVLAYHHFARSNVQAGLDDVLKRYNNTVTLWNAHPQDSDLSLVVGCLR
jgi:hypothetical protein